MTIRLIEAAFAPLDMACTGRQRHAEACAVEGHVWVGTGDDRVICDECGVPRGKSQPVYAPKPIQTERRDGYWRALRVCDGQQFAGVGNSEREAILDLLHAESDYFADEFLRAESR